MSQAQLANAINATSAKTNNVGTLDSPFADPGIEAMRQKLNEMILNGRRQGRREFRQSANTPTAPPKTMSDGCKKMARRHKTFFDGFA